MIRDNIGCLAWVLVGTLVISLPFILAGYDRPHTITNEVGIVVGSRYQPNTRHFAYLYPIYIYDGSNMNIIWMPVDEGEFEGWYLDIKYKTDGGIETIEVTQDVFDVHGTVGTLVRVITETGKRTRHIYSRTIGPVE